MQLAIEFSIEQDLCCVVGNVDCILVLSNTMALKGTLNNCVKQRKQTINSSLFYPNLFTACAYLLGQVTFLAPNFGSDLFFCRLKTNIFEWSALIYYHLVLNSIPPISFLSGRYFFIACWLLCVFFFAEWANGNKCAEQRLNLKSRFVRSKKNHLCTFNTPKSCFLSKHF